MKQLLFVLVLVLCAFYAEAQHPLEVKLDVLHTWSENPEISLEYGLLKRLGIEAGIQFIKYGYEVDYRFDSTKVSYQIDYRERRYYAKLKYYFGVKEAIQGGFVAIQGFYKHFTDYKKDSTPEPFPSDARGIAFEGGYKWLFWKKMVVEVGGQVIFDHRWSFNQNLPARNRSQLNIDIGILAKIGYRF